MEKKAKLLAFDVNECLLDCVIPMPFWCSPAQHDHQAAIAQLVARRSHNPKVVSSILTGRICVSTVLATTHHSSQFQWRHRHVSG